MLRFVWRKVVYEVFQSCFELPYAFYPVSGVGYLTWRSQSVLQLNFTRSLCIQRMKMLLWFFL